MGFTSYPIARYLKFVQATSLRMMAGPSTGQDLLVSALIEMRKRGSGMAFS